MRVTRSGAHRPAGRLLTGVLAAVALAVAGCGSSDGGDGGSAGPSARGSVTVAAFNFGESKLLANIYAGALERAGYDVTVKALGAREVVEPALQKGSADGGVDVVPEYLATFTEFLNKAANGTDAPPKASGDVAATLAAARALAAPVGIEVLEPSAAADQNAFAVTQEFATAHGLAKLSDLAGYTGPLVLGGPAECPTRPFCQPGLERTYGLTITGFKSLDVGGPLTKKALQSGQVQLGLVFSSDGGVEAFGLKVLEDDKHLQNADNVVAAVNRAVVSQPLTAALDGVAAALTTDDLVAMNKRVDIDGEDAEDVAAQWLDQHGLG